MGVREKASLCVGDLAIAFVEVSCTFIYGSWWESQTGGNSGLIQFHLYDTANPV